MSCCNTNGSTAVREPVARERRAYEPNVDIYETADDWVILADVPGVARDGIDLNFDDGVLTVAARVAPRSASPAAGARPLVREYPVGDFERRFRVGDGIDAARINASLDAGVLTVHLPKAESSKPRKIEIKGL